MIVHLKSQIIDRAQNFKMLSVFIRFEYCQLPHDTIRIAIHLCNTLGQSPWGMARCMAVGTINWGMVETGPFFVRGRTVDSGGGGLLFEINILVVRVPMKLNKKILHP